MLYDNPTLHNGFVITGSGVRLFSGQWHCQLLIERPGFAPSGMEVVPLCNGMVEAEQQAISAGCKMVDLAGFGLWPAR
jgi:hypothetical protein